VPEVGCRLTFEVLGFALSLEDGDELGRQGDGLAAPFLDFPEDQTAALAVGACCRVPGCSLAGSDAGAELACAVTSSSAQWWAAFNASYSELRASTRAHKQLRKPAE
jgi:hypothetical protein